MAWNMVKSLEGYILDTSAFISLESISILDKVLRLFLVITTDSVIKELEEFAKYNDSYGKIAKDVLKKKSQFKIETCEVKELIRFIEKTDNDLYNLSLKIKQPLVTDETKLVHHTRDKIDVYFSPVFLIFLSHLEYLTKQEALELLEKLRDIRNWKSNIIYLAIKDQLDNLDK